MLELDKDVEQHFEVESGRMTSNEDSDATQTNQDVREQNSNVKDNPLYGAIDEMIRMIRSSQTERDREANEDG